VRSRKEGELGEVSLAAFIEKLSEEIRMRVMWEPPAGNCARHTANYWTKFSVSVHTIFRLRFSFLPVFFSRAMVRSFCLAMLTHSHARMIKHFWVLAQNNVPPFCACFYGTKLCAFESENAE